MKLIDIIKELERLGHKVSYTHRKDGGYVIRKIDGMTYSGKTGNQIARNIVGAKLSIARSVQLKRIRTPKGKRNVKKTSLPEELEKRLKYIQRQWRKKHPTIEGTISKRGLRYQFEMYGKEKALLSLDKAYRYSQGYAYTENVQHLIERINLDLNKDNNSEMSNARDLIEQKMMIFKEEWLQPIYNSLYDWEKQIIQGEECARIIIAIIK